MDRSHIFLGLLIAATVLLFVVLQKHSHSHNHSGGCCHGHVHTAVAGVAS